MFRLTASVSGHRSSHHLRFNTTIVSKGRSELLCVSVAELKVCWRFLMLNDKNVKISRASKMIFNYFTTRVQVALQKSNVELQRTCFSLKCYVPICRGNPRLVGNSWLFLTHFPWNAGDPGRRFGCCAGEKRDSAGSQELPKTQQKKV